MPTKSPEIDAFLAAPALALVGASSTKKKFGNIVRDELMKNGYRVHLLHPTAETIDGAPCLKHLIDLPEPVGGVVLSIPEERAEGIIRDAASAKIPSIWLLSGAASAKTAALCAELGITCISGTCIVMYLRNIAWFHRAHRWVHDTMQGAKGS